MHIDLEKRQATLPVGEFADFLSGPWDGQGGPQGLWRAQLGTHWHQEFRKFTLQEYPEARFELTLSGQILHRGWILSLSGRIDQLIPQPSGCLELREIKTVLRTLPCDETDLRADYGSYFVQVACYRRLLQSDSRVLAVDDPLGLPQANGAVLAKLVFVEADTGLSQSLSLASSDEGILEAQLERVVAFLEARRKSLERLRKLQLRAPFEVFRTGQEAALEGLRSALSRAQGAILLEAPTGFGKTGVVLDAALSQMKAGHFERLIYLTSKATGQLQVVRTLRSMCPEDSEGPGGDPVSTWLTRPKAEHCIAPTFHCVRDVCVYLQELGRKWERAGLARHFLDPLAPRDLASLRRSGQDAGVCPYEITRAALPFCDLWIGDFNYVFSPASQGVFLQQPGFNASRTLLIVDEAHNLPTRVADAFSRRFTYEEALDCLDGLRHIRAPQPLIQVWDHWTHFLRHVAHCHSLSLDAEDDARDILSQVSRKLSGLALDYARLGPVLSEALWKLPSLNEELQKYPKLARLWWAPKDQTLQLSCLDAAPFIGDTLREFGGVILASATFGPLDSFEAALGLEPSRNAQSPVTLNRLPENEEPEQVATGKLGKLTKRDSKKLFKHLTTGAELLRVEERAEAQACVHLKALAPWREEAYDMAIDLRVDTSFQHRERHYGITAETIESWVAEPGERGPLAVFFPSYAYAEAIIETLRQQQSHVRVSLQPRKLELSEQAEWVEKALLEAQALFLILGSSFAESIDVLGGRVQRALVVGPALPEVNAIQQARMAQYAKRGRDLAFRTVYQIPGMQKVNQALGRLVRAPGQKARILLHCRRFAEPGYHALLGSEYHRCRQLADDAAWKDWLKSR